MESSGTDATLKIILLGDSMVGKTSIIRRYTSNEFEEKATLTLGAGFLSKTIKMEEKTIKLKIWDTAGQEKYKSLTTKGLICYLLLINIDFKNVYPEN